MSAPEEHSSGRGASRSSAGALLRAVGLILVAVVIGVILLDATDEPLPRADDEVVAATGGTERPGTTELPTDPDTTDPDTSDPDTSDPDTTDPDTADPGTNDPETADPDATVSTTTTSTTASTSTTSTTTAAEMRSPGEVSVLVANGSGVSGAATRLSEEVGTLGYLTAVPTNVQSGGQVEASVVFYAAGYRAEATELAATFSPAPAVRALPDTAPVEDLRGASLLVVLGTDLAGG